MKRALLPLLLAPLLVALLAGLALCVVEVLVEGCWADLGALVLVLRAWLVLGCWVGCPWLTPAR